MELRELLAPLRKWWWLIAAATLVAVASSFLAVWRQPLIYQARATLMVGRAIDNPNPSNAEFSLSQQLAMMYADIAQREPMRDRTMAALGLNWLPEYTVRALPNTQLLEIVVTDTSPERAQVVANELANQLVLQSPTATRPEQRDRQDFVNEQLDELEVKIQETQDEIAAKQDELKDLVSAREIRDVQDQISGLQTKLSTLQSNYAALLSNTERGATNTITIIDPASLPRRPVGPDKLMNILMAAAAAFVLAGAAAYVLEYLDDTVKTSEDVSRIAGLPTLGTIAHIPEIRDPVDHLVTLRHSRSPISEAFRVLRTNLQFSYVTNPSATLLVTSAALGEGKTTTAANLAITMAQSGKRVILADCDLRRPSVHRLFRLRNDRGLTDLLLNETIPLETVLIETELPELKILLSGPLPPNPAELLGSAPMERRIREMREAADLVVFDSPPLLVVADPAILGALAGRALLVIAAGRTRREAVQQMVAAADRAGLKVLGAVLNMIPTPGVKAYYYQYYSPAGPDDAQHTALAGTPAVPLGPGGRLRGLLNGKSVMPRTATDQETDTGLSSESAV